MSSGKRLTLLLLVICLTAVWLGRGWGGSRLLRHLVLPTVEKRLPGLHLEFHDLTTNLISRITVNGIAATYCQDGVCQRLDVPRAQLTFALTDILSARGEGRLLSHVTVTLDHARIEGELSSADTDLSLELPSLPALPAITVVDSTFVLRAGDIAISALGLNLSAPAFVPAAGAVYPVRIQAQQAAVTGTSWPLPAGELAAQLALGAGRIEVPELFFQQSLLLDHGVLAQSGNELRLSMNLHLLRSEGLVQGSLRGQEAAISFTLSEGDLKTLAAAAGGVPKVSGHLQARGEFTMTVGQMRSLEGSLTASVAEGSWAGSPVEHLQVSVRAHDQLLHVEGLELEMGENRLTVRDGVLPLAQLEGAEGAALLAAAQGRAEIRLRHPEALPPAWRAPWMPDWQALGLSRVTAQLSLDKGHLTVVKAEAEGKAGKALVTEGDVDLSGPLDDGEKIPARFAWQVELNDAAVVRHFWEPWPAVGGKAHGRGRFSGTLSQPHLPFSATFTGASLYGARLEQVAGELAWTKDRLALQIAARNGDHDRLTLDGVIDLDQGGLINTEVTTELDDIHPYLPKALIGDSLLSGPLNGTATLDGPFTHMTGAVQASGDWRVDGVGLNRAVVAANINGRQWEVKRFATTLDQGVEIDASGRIETGLARGRATVALASLELGYRDERLHLLSPGVVTIAPGKVAVKEALTLTGPAGDFRVQGEMGDAAGLTLRGSQVRDTGLLRHLSATEMGFTSLEFTLKLGGPLGALSWRWQATVGGLKVEGAPFALAGRVDLASDARGLWLREGYLSNQNHAISLSGHLPVVWRGGKLATVAAPLELQGVFDVPRGGLLPRLFPQWLSESGAVHADLTLTGTWEHPRGQLRISADGLTPGPRLAMVPEGPFQVTTLLALESDRLRIDQGQVTATGIGLRLTGSIAELPWADLIQGRREVIPGVAEIQGEYDLPDLSWLAAKVPALRRSGGQVKGSFSVTGPLASPRARAALTLRGGEARAQDVALVVRDLAMDASLDEGRLTIAQLSGTLGGSPVHGSGRVLRVFSDDPELDLHLSGKDLLLYRADGVKIRADTTLAMAGALSRPELSGEVLLTDSRINKRVDWLSLLRPGARKPLDTGFSLFSFTDPPWKNMRLNLRLKAAKPLEIVNSFFKGSVRPDLLLTGSGEVPYLLGVVFSDSGKLTLPAGRLDLERGLIRFSEDNPDRPLLETQATGRMMGYDITAQVRGPYDEPEVTLSSAPPLASEDLLMLLLTGRRPLSAGNGGVSTMAVFLGRGLLSRLFGEEFSNALLLDRLEVDVGRAVTQQGEPTVDARVKLADGLWRQGTSLYLTGEKDIWDYYNAGLRMVVHFR